MAVSKSDLKFYLTSAEPSVGQTDAAQSTGGYPSTTEITGSSELASSFNLDSATVSLTSSLTGVTKLLIDGELIAVSGNGSHLTIESRGALTTQRSGHIAGSPVFTITPNNLFNNSFNDDSKQYRCIAVKNTNEDDTFYDVKFYIRSGSLNSSVEVKMAVEVPQTDAFSSTASGGGTISLTDTSLIGDYEDNELADCVITFLSGNNVNLSRKVSTFDSDTGIFVFTTSVPFDVANGDEYIVSAAPSQRVESGLISPVFDNVYTTELLSAAGAANAISIDEKEIRVHGVDMEPHDVVYLWFERSTETNAEAYSNNRIMFTARYKTE